MQNTTQASIPTSHPKPAGIIEKHLPAPQTTRAGGADRERAPGLSEPKRAAGDPNNGMEDVLFVYLFRI